MTINKLIEQIGGRERLEAFSAGHYCSVFECQNMALALLAVLDAKPVGEPSLASIDNLELELGTKFHTIPTAASVPTAMQPLYIAGDGRIRFKENAIVRHLLTSAGKVGVDLNSIAMDDFSDDDRMQLAQLIGYSLGGYGELSYVSDESYNAAVKAAPAPGGEK